MIFYSYIQSYFSMYGISTGYCYESANVVTNMGWENANTHNSETQAIVDWQADIQPDHSRKRELDQG